MIILRGTDKNGNVKFYTGKAGEGWLSADQNEGFPYAVSGARAKATLFNKMSEIHGWRFIAFDTEKAQREIDEQMDDFNYVGNRNHY